MSYELFVSIRHLKVKKSQKFIALNTWISVGGVALGVMALIVVIAVMTGFGNDLRDKILGTNSHIVVTNINRVGMAGYGDIIKRIESIDGVKAASPFIMSQVMLTFGDSVSGVIVRGVDPKLEADVSDLGKYLTRGELSFLDETVSRAKKKSGIILGHELARKMGVVPDDLVSIISPASRLTPVGLIPKMKLFRVVGIFESGMYEYDSNLAFISIASAQKFFSMKGKVTGIEIRVQDIDQANVVAGAIQEALGFPYFARDWMRMNRNLFSALRMEKIVMFVILILIILVAAFNIVSTLFMVVMEKTKEIAILKSMGATSKSIMMIFSMQGLFIGLTGTFLGCIGGFTIVPNINEIVGVIESLFGVTAFPSEIYYLDKLPSEIQYTDSVLIIIFSIIICFLASLYPAWRASRMNPVDGLRYE
jgi:lipoprotein-releasing system permease protein